MCCLKVLEKCLQIDNKVKMKPLSVPLIHPNYYCLHEKPLEHQETMGAHMKERLCEDPVRVSPLQAKERGLRGSQMVAIMIFSLQNCRKVSLCCLSHQPVGLCIAA